MSFLNKIKEFASTKPALARQGIEKIGDLVDQKTGGKFAGQVDVAQQKAEEALLDGNAEQTAPQTSSADAAGEATDPQQNPTAQ